MEIGFPRSFPGLIVCCIGTGNRMSRRDDVQVARVHPKLSSVLGKLPCF